MMALLAWLTLLASLATASVLFCAATSFLFLLTPLEARDTWAWMDFSELGGPVIELGVLVDGLSKMMLLVVGWVGSAIFVFALGYMKGDPGIGRFFAKFALFVFSMLASCSPTTS